jgi:signal peptidase I
MTNEPMNDILHYDDGAPQKQSGGWRRFTIDLIETLLLALVLYLAINFLTARVYVEGSSMVPTFSHGDFLIVNRMAYRWGELERGDVIVFPYPGNPEDDYIKRVIALPGDTFQIENGRVFVNGILLEEPYVSGPSLRDFPQLAVPPQTVFVLGDNRNDSSDSRAWGPLQVDDILGKAVLRYWPLSDLSLVQHPDLDGAVGELP